MTRCRGTAQSWPATRVDHRPLLERGWQLRNSLSAPDALYVALAEALDATLLTLDQRLTRADGPPCRVEIPRRAEICGMRANYRRCVAFRSLSPSVPQRAQRDGRIEVSFAASERTKWRDSESNRGHHDFQLLLWGIRG
jgi:hypothetical protein